MLGQLCAFLLPNDLDAILDVTPLKGALVSCTVVDDSGQVIFERNSSSRVMPASNQKLLSNSFALYKLGPDYQPQTKIWKREDSVFVDSPGDPMMTHQRLQKAATILKLGRNRQVYVHQAYAPYIGPSWEWDDLPNKYAAPICAFTVDRGSVELWSNAGKLSVLPYPYWLRPVWGSRSGPKKVDYDPIRRTLVLNGDLPNGRIRQDTLALDRPDIAAASFFGKGFYHAYETPTSPPDLILGGPPLKVACKECLVHSDNNIAENLLLMAAAKDKPLGNDPYAVADLALTKFLSDVVGATVGDFRPQDGSGMSRHNVVTTRGIVKLLQWAVQQPTKDVWLDALAKPGAGTLGDRLKGVPFVGKTGTLDMVVALSGYVHTSKGRTLTVSLILNHFICNENVARGIADEFIKKLVADDGFGTVPANSGPHEARTAHPGTLSPDAGWHDRSGRHRVDARQWPDRRAQPAHASFHRKERMAFRIR